MPNPSPDLPASGIWCCRGHKITWGGRTLVMGVLNVTPDSFSDGGRHLEVDAAVARALEMTSEGADIIDVGGESSRPGAEPVSAAEEMERVIPVIQKLSQHPQVVISIDTVKVEVARAALTAGAHIINDISAGRYAASMLELARESGAGLLLMHMKGEPRTMQDAPFYKDVVAQVRQFLMGRIWEAEAAGVAREAIAIDPGIGFGKTFDHNWELLRHLDRFVDIGVPVLLGVSRKRFLGALCDRPVEERLAASLATAAAAALAGVAMIRAHDVKETCDAMRVAAMLRQT